MYVKRTNGEGAFLKCTKAYKEGVGGGGSKIAKFERTFFLNDPLVSFWFLAIVL